ncbi:hypothetical protein [Halobacillus karajensis]|nr:hypothetical protein [Halobacillus karajensis]
MAGRGNSWLAIGAAGAIGAAAMYGINRMNQNGGGIGNGSKSTK